MPYTDELIIALSRPDIDVLHRVVETYYDWTRQNDDSYPDEIDIWSDAQKDTDMAMALIPLAVAKYDDESVLAVVAAGLLENLVRHQPALNGAHASDELIERIVTGARRNSRFRWMLSGMWLGDPLTEAQEAKIVSAVGEMSMDRGVACPPKLPV